MKSFLSINKKKIRPIDEANESFCPKYNDTIFFYLVRAYLRSVLPIFLFPANKCLGFFSWMCRSDSPALPARLVVLACILLCIVFSFLRVSGSRTPDWSRGARELLRLRPTGSDSTSILDRFADLKKIKALKQLI